MSPERVDPGRTDWTTKTTPKIVGGITPACTRRRRRRLPQRAIDTVHDVSTPEAAELTKLLENIFRSVNIALVNELAQLCDRMGIDVWEVVDAAATKPFGFMRFKPGPGLGGHCIPIDPFYLAWKAREYDFYTEFIELAGKINENMPYFCRSEDLAGAEPRSQKSRQGLDRSSARRRLQGGHRRHARVAGAEARLAAAGRGRRRLLPRPARARVREQGLTSVVARRRARGCRLRRDRHRPLRDRLRRPGRARPARRRLPQRDRRQRQPRTAACGSCSPDARSRLAGLGSWGAEPRPQLRRAGAARLGLRHRRGRLAAAAARYPGARATASFDELLGGRDRRGGRRRDARADALRARAPGARGGQARLRREAAGDAQRTTTRARRARRRARPRADARPPAPLPPRRPQAEGAGRRRASSATSSASTGTARTWARSGTTRTRSGRWACTTSR